MTNNGRIIKGSTLFIMSGFLYAVGPLMVDLSLPSMLAVQADLAPHGMHVELTLTGIFFALAAAQFAFGAIADRFGRRKLLVATMLLFSLAGFIASLSENMIEFGVARLVQGFAYGIAGLLSIAIVADSCDEQRSAKVLSVAFMAMSVMIVVAPTAGAALLAAFSWRSVFVTMGVVGLLMTIYIWLTVPETFPPALRSTQPISRVVALYVSLLQKRQFAKYLLVGSLGAATQYTYDTGVSSILLEHYGLSPAACGLSLSVVGLSMALASLCNAFVLKWWPPRRITYMAAWFAFAAALLLTISVLSGIGGVTGFIIAVTLELAAICFIVTNSMASALSLVGAHAGAASALICVMQFVVGMIGSGIVGLFHDPQGRPLAFVLTVFSAGSVALILRIPKRATVPQDSQSVAS